MATTAPPANPTSAPSFASRLLAVRNERGMKRSEVAARIGSTGPAYGRYERGDRVPSVETAQRIAAALGVSLDYLVGETTVVIKDRRMLYRLEVLERVSPKHRERILYTLDVLLRDAQADTLDARLS